MKESLERINVISNIGHLTQHLKRIVENPDDEVHIGGDYKAIAPQSLIKKHKKEFIIGEFKCTVFPIQMYKKV